MIKRINIYMLIKVLFILAALSLILIIRAGYHQMSARYLADINPTIYFDHFTFDYMAIRLLSFGVLFAACFNLKAAMEKRLHLNKTGFILSLILLLLSLIDYCRLYYQGLFEFMSVGSFIYLQATRYLTLVVSALAGFLCCSSFKTK